MNSLQYSDSSIKTEFIQNYGSYASQFPALDSLGNQRSTGYILYSVFAFILMIIMFVVTQDKIDPVTKQTLPKTTIDNILTYFKYASIVLFLITLSYNGYMYFFVYLTQYGKWLLTLPDTAKASLLSINTLDSIIAQQNSIRNAQTNKPNTGISLDFGNQSISIR